jgi:hypothetical protein
VHVRNWPKPKHRCTAPPLLLPPSVSSTARVNGRVGVTRHRLQVLCVRDLDPPLCSASCLSDDPGCTRVRAGRGYVLWKWRRRMWLRRGVGAASPTSGDRFWACAILDLIRPFPPPNHRLRALPPAHACVLAWLRATSRWPEWSVVGDGVTKRASGLPYHFDHSSRQGRVVK